jgi:hypothetical protein
VTSLSSFAKASAYYSSYAQLPPLARPVTHSWVFTSVDDNRLCEQCDEFRGESYELEDPGELEEAFPFGEQVDSATFACNIHPNCRCIMERVT